MSDPNVNPFAPPAAAIDAPPVSFGFAKPAERGQRLVAVILDGLVFTPCVIFIAIFAFQARGGGNMAPPLAIVSAILGGLYFLAIAAMQLTFLSKRGQTLGKRWMGIRIVKLDGSNPGFVHAFLLRAVVNGLIGAIPYLGGIYALVDILLIFREDRRCIHDLIAGTQVVVVA